MAPAKFFYNRATRTPKKRVLYYYGSEYKANSRMRESMITMHASQKGWIVIPAHLREKYRI